jgi:FlaA1/EpsC-like NDP-sugar epimerase
VDAVRGHLRAYHAAREAFVSRVTARLQRAVRDRRRVVIYGAGTHTAELWRLCPFLSEHVIAMVDGNPRLQGHEFLGVPVHRPRALAQLDPDLIVISVRTAETQIARYLAAEGFGPLVLRLYEDTGAAAA